jgi:hypothetical protein
MGVVEVFLVGGGPRHRDGAEDRLLGCWSAADLRCPPLVLNFLTQKKILDEKIEQKP